MNINKTLNNKKQESRTLLEKEFEKANNIINIKTKELNTEKYEKTVELSKLKGEEKVLEVKNRHLLSELEDKEKENCGLKVELNNIECDIEQLTLDCEKKLNLVKEKRKELENSKRMLSSEHCNKKNDCANINEESKTQISEIKTQYNQILFSNQMKKEECDKLKKELESIEKQYHNVLSVESQGIKKAKNIFKEMREM